MCMWLKWPQSLAWTHVCSCVVEKLIKRMLMKFEENSGEKRPAPACRKHLFPTFHLKWKWILINHRYHQCDWLKCIYNTRIQSINQRVMMRYVIMISYDRNIIISYVLEMDVWQPLAIRVCINAWAHTHISMHINAPAWMLEWIWVILRRNIAKKKN